MTPSFLRSSLTAAAVLAATALPIPALAADVELLPPGLLSPTSKEQTKPNEFKKPGPWRIGVSFGGVGNTWIVQMIQEMKHAAAQDKNIGEFIFVEANWQAPKQVADVEDLLAKKVDAIIIGPIASTIGAPPFQPRMRYRSIATVHSSRRPVRARARANSHARTTPGSVRVGWDSPLGMPPCSTSTTALGARGPRAHRNSGCRAIGRVSSTARVAVPPPAGRCRTPPPSLPAPRRRRRPRHLSGRGWPRRTRRGRLPGSSASA